jgi:thioredoxin 1
MAMNVTTNNFQNEVIDAKEPVLIDFFANWCVPCKMLSPVIDELAQEMPSVKVVKVNVDEEPELAQKFQVMSIPTLVVMKDGKMVNKTIGVRPKDEIREMLEV